MNRSLEALAIFTICLGGILAVVRCSTTNRSVTEPSVVERAKSAPDKNCGSAAEQPAPANFEIAYNEGCGLDRHDGQVYSPLSPLLSPREVALLAIRSQPIPLVVLPAAADLTESTGYDAAYDIAMGKELPSPADVTRSQMEAEYAAAELAAAAAGAATGTFTVVAPTELTPPSPTWELISGSLSAVRSDLTKGSLHLRRSYVDPISRGVENRLLRMPLPSLNSPAAKTEARQQLLFHQRAGITWDDYLAFVGHRLPIEPGEAPQPRVARQKSPRNVLWPR